MKSAARFTHLTGEPTEGLLDGQFLVLGRNDPSLGALASKLRVAGLPDDEVVVVGAFTTEVA
ncbi:MAG: hypothetical protein WA944_24275, partial [Mycobacterium sp.]